MCDICHEGGQVLGPFLKPMTHLVHTEYLLAGRTRSDVRDVLRDTMFAATVTGAPVENACRLIKQYESEGRGYYGAALALIGRDDEGAPDRGQPDRDPHRRRLPGRRAQGDRRRDAGPRLRPRLRGGRDARQGRRHPQRLRPRARGVRGARERRRAHARRGRADRARLAQPAALPVLADRPVRRRPAPRAQGPVGGRARRRGRLREHAEPRVLRARHDDDGGPPRGLPARRARRLRPGRGRPRARRPARRRVTPRSRRTGRRSTPSSRPTSRSSRSAWATRCCATGSGSPLPTRTSSSRAPSRRSTSFGRQERVGFYNTFVARGDGRLPEGVRVEPPTRRPATSTCVAGPHYRGRAVPRRVDPHRERLRAAPRPAARPAGTRRWAEPRVLVVDHYDSYTWNLVHLVASVTGALPDVVEHDQRGASTVVDGYSHVVLSPGPGHPDDERLLRRSAADPARRRRPGARGLPGHAGPGHGVRRDGCSGSHPAHGEIAVVRHDGEGLFAGVPDAVRGGALPLARGRRAARVLRRTAVDEVSGVAMAVAHRSCRCTACSSTPSRSCRSTAPTWSGTSSRERPGSKPPERAPQRMFWLDGGGARDWSGRRSIVGRPPRRRRLAHLRRRQRARCAGTGAAAARWSATTCSRCSRPRWRATPATPTCTGSATSATPAVPTCPVGRRPTCPTRCGCGSGRRASSTTPHRVECLAGRRRQPRQHSTPEWYARGVRPGAGAAARRQLLRGQPDLPREQVQRRRPGDGVPAAARGQPGAVRRATCGTTPTVAACTCSAPRRSGSPPSTGSATSRPRRSRAPRPAARPPRTTSGCAHHLATGPQVPRREPDDHRPAPQRPVDGVRAGHGGRAGADGGRVVRHRAPAGHHGPRAAP